MADKAQSMGLSLLGKIAGSTVIDQLKLRKFIEKSLYHGAKTGFKTLSQTQKIFKANKQQQKQRLPFKQSNLFDLNMSEEQRMACEAMQQFAQEVLYPLAHDADQTESFPHVLWQQVQDLGLNIYALPEAYQGVATEKEVLSHVLIAEHLGQGDFSLAAGLLSSFSVINCIAQWGSKQIQNTYLPAFAEQSDLHASFAVQENTPAFNPFRLKTRASSHEGQFTLYGEKTLVLLGESADLFIVSAEFNQRPEVFIVERDDSIQCKKSPAMGLKATETVDLFFNHTPAQRLADEILITPHLLTLAT